MKLPSDIKSYVKGNILKKVGKWLFFTFTLALFIILFNDSFKNVDAGVRAFVYAAILLIPFFLLKMPKLIFDRSFEGIIERIYTVDGVGTTSKAIPTYETTMRTVEVSAEVRISASKTKTIVIYSGRFDSRVAKILNNYQVGNRIIHICGAKHDQIVTADKISCIVCGHNNKRSRTTCAECGSSLNLSN